VKRHLDQQLKFRQLRAIAVIAQHGSLLAASRALGITQPALTKMLHDLEDILGLRLFERHARGVLPNDHGLLVSDAARKILNVLRELEDGLERLDQQASGTVVIGALPIAAAGVMPEVIRRLRALEPSLVVRVIEDRTDELLSLLTLGDVDLVVGRLYPSVTDDANLVRTELYEEPFDVIVGAQHPLAALKLVTAEDLARYEISMPVVSFRIYAETRAFLEAHGVTPREGTATTSIMLMRDLLLSSDLVTVMPRLMLTKDITQGAMKVLPLAPGARKPAPRPAGLICRADRPIMPPVQRVIDTITSYVAELCERAVA
jgi:LysR family pca operon transcriptional activator